MNNNRHRSDFPIQDVRIPYKYRETSPCCDAHSNNAATICGIRCRQTYDAAYKLSGYKKRSIQDGCFFFSDRNVFAVWTGLEPATSCVTGRHSNQLNYHTVYCATCPVKPQFPNLSSYPRFRCANVIIKNKPAKKTQKYPDIIPFFSKPARKRKT